MFFEGHLTGLLLSTDTTVSFTFHYLNPPEKEPDGHKHIKI